VVPAPEAHPPLAEAPNPLNHQMLLLQSSLRYVCDRFALTALLKFEFVFQTLNGIIAALVSRIH
jgi:hypothetical protein